MTPNPQDSAVALEVLSDERIIAVVARIASTSLNVTRVHELDGVTRTLMEEEGVIEIGRALLAEIGRLRASQSDGTSGGWLPIASAPKDGTKIIIADIGDGYVYDVVNGYFEVLTEDEEDGPWSLDGGEPHCSYVGRAEGTYFCSWLPGKELDQRWSVGDSFPYTHWMPLPAAPTQGENHVG